MSKRFSKGSWPARFALLTLVGALVVSFGVLSWPGEAEANGRKKKQVWSVKWNCLDNGNSVKTIGGTAVGKQTFVNIHNPSDDSVLFNIKFIISDSQVGGDGSVKTDKQGISLPGNLVYSVNCKDIFNAVAAVTTPSDFGSDSVIEGFVVIEAGKKTVLAVCATYQFGTIVTATSQSGGGTSIHVLCYNPNKIKGSNFESCFEDDEPEGCESL